MADVARLAGVSVSTVSYALSGTRPISVATRERIEQAMLDLGYTPNAFARGLKSKRSRIIALVLPAAADRRLSLLDHILGVGDHAHSRGYQLMLWPCDPDSGIGLARLAAQGLVDGALVMDVRVGDPRVAVLVEAGVPFAIVGRNVEYVENDSAETDFVQTCRDTVRYLVGQGHRRMGLVRCPDATGCSREFRLEQALRAAAGRDLAVTSVEFGAGARGGVTDLDRLFASGSEVSAVVAVGESVVPGLLYAVQERGLHIPEKISILAFDLPTQLAESSVPAMTTVGPSGAQIGRAAVDLLLRRLDDTAAPARHLLLRGEMQHRGSCGPARDTDR